jgi:hypothetical protein
MRGELGEPILRLVLDPEQHVGEIRLGVDVVALAHRDERVEDHESARRLHVAEEERFFLNRASAASLALSSSRATRRVA